MPVKMRLARRGRKRAPFYHIVIADARAPRDGRFITQIGSYNPMTKPATIELDREAAYDWLMKGAQPTDTVRAILRFKGVLYRKHLMRGVKKGALTQEQADAKLQEWIAAKEAKIAERVDQTRKEKQELLAKLSGTAPKIEVPATEEEHQPGELDSDKPFADQVEQTTVESVSGEATEAPAEEPATEEKPAEEPATEEKPAEESPAEEPKAEEKPVEEPKEEKPAEETPAPTTAPEDLTKIEGIGPKIAETLNAAGINTYAELAAATPEAIKEILDKAEGNFAAHDPATWPKQSQMAADGKWDELKKWQDELDGGKEKTEE